MIAHIKYLIILLLILFSKLSHADELISLIKITGNVQISGDMKNWVTVKKPQKIKLSLGKPERTTPESKEEGPGI